MHLRICFYWSLFPYKCLESNLTISMVFLRCYCMFGESYWFTMKDTLAMMVVDVGMNIGLWWLVLPSYPLYPYVYIYIYVYKCVIVMFIIYIYIYIWLCMIVCIYIYIYIDIYIYISHMFISDIHVYHIFMYLTTCPR